MFDMLYNVFFMWNIFFLAIIGKLVDNEYEPLGEVNWSTRHTTASNCYIGAGLYGGFLIISVARFIYLRKNPKQLVLNKAGNATNPYANLSNNIDSSE